MQFACPAPGFTVSIPCVVESINLIYWSLPVPKPKSNNTWSVEQAARALGLTKAEVCNRLASGQLHGYQMTVFNG